MTRDQKIADLIKMDPKGLNAAIQRNLAKIRAMSEEEFQKHQAAKEANTDRKDAIQKTASRLAAELIAKVRK